MLEQDAPSTVRSEDDPYVVALSEISLECIYANDDDDDDGS